MSIHGKTKVAIAGATGAVGRRFAELLINHPWYEVVMLVGFKSVGARFGDIWAEKESNICAHYGQDIWRIRECPEALRDIPVQGINALVGDRTVNIVFSAIPSNAWYLEQQLLETGFTVFSNSPYGRFDDHIPLIVAEVNGEELGDQNFIKSPNCVTSGLALILASLRKRYGLKAVSVVTFQSLTGKGDAKYPQELVVGNVYPLNKSDEHIEQYIATEIRKIFRDQIPMSISCNRVFVQEGHYVDVKIKTRRRVKSWEDVATTLRTFNPLKKYSLPSGPEAPIFVIDEVGRPRPRQDSFHNHGMTVAVGGISTEDDIYDIRMQYVVNNLVRGAAGGAIQNSELYMQKRIGIPADNRIMR
jgi:aspartate-semialdehyde dehydrogenase